MCQGDSTQPATDEFWRIGADVGGARGGTGAAIFRPDIYAAIDAAIQGLDGELRRLSLDLHGAPRRVSPACDADARHRPPGAEVRGAVRGVSFLRSGAG